jgi:hypothetical protein
MGKNALISGIGAPCMGFENVCFRECAKIRVSGLAAHALSLRTSHPEPEHALLFRPLNYLSAMGGISSAALMGWLVFRIERAQRLARLPGSAM